MEKLNDCVFDSECPSEAENRSLSLELALILELYRKLNNGQQEAFMSLLDGLVANQTH